MKYCGNCGREMKDNAKFCTKCGAKHSVPTDEVFENSAQNIVATAPEIISTPNPAPEHVATENNPTVSPEHTQTNESTPPSATEPVSEKSYSPTSAAVNNNSQNMKYCSKCGKELFVEAVICPACGCPCQNINNTFSIPNQPFIQPQISFSELVNKLSQKLLINAIIWIIIGVLQAFLGFYLQYTFVCIIGLMNIGNGILNISYCNNIKSKPVGIVKRFEPIILPLITLVYNLIFGGIIGVAGSIYYFVGIRNYVITNRAVLEQGEQEYLAQADIYNRPT